MQVFDFAQKYPEKVKELAKLLESIKMKNSKEGPVSIQNFK